MTLLDCIKACIKGETIEYNEDDSSLVKLALEQSLQTILYPVTNNDKYLSYYVSWSLKQEKFFSIQNKITSLLNENGINHLFFKGAVISDLYPDRAIRTRGDIDFYVDIKNFEKAEEILLKNGFTKILGEDCSHHSTLSYQGVDCELHFNLFDDDVSNVLLNIFKNPLSLSKALNGNLEIMDDTYHLIYCICHFAKHLRHGAGIRYILDFYYMIKKTNLDFELLHNIISKLKLNRLYENIINAIHYISDEYLDETVEKKNIDFFIEYMLSYGIHGHANNNETSMQASHNNKFKYVMSKTFLTNKQYRISRYPKLGKHWFLYPICLIKHWIYLLTHKIGGLFKMIFGKNKNKKLYKDLGI